VKTHEPILAESNWLGSFTPFCAVMLICNAARRPSISAVAAEMRISMRGADGWYRYIRFSGLMDRSYYVAALMRGA
jgi:hypothetical protein